MIICKILGHRFVPTLEQAYCKKIEDSDHFNTYKLYQIFFCRNCGATCEVVVKDENAKLPIGVDDKELDKLINRILGKPFKPKRKLFPKPPLKPSE